MKRTKHEQDTGDHGDAEDAAYDKSHFPEYVRFGDKVMHRDAVPDDIAQLIDMLGEPVGAPEPALANTQSMPPTSAATGEGPEWEADSSDTDTSSSSESSSDDSSSDDDANTAASPQTHTRRTAPVPAEESEDSDDDVADGMELLNPFEAAKMLMAEEVSDNSKALSG